MPDMVATGSPIPLGVSCHDPYTPSAASTFTRALLAVGLDVVRTSPGLGTQLAVAAMRLSRIGRDFVVAAAATIPPTLLSIRYWNQWLDQFGTVAFRGRK